MRTLILFVLSLTLAACGQTRRHDSSAPGSASQASAAAAPVAGIDAPACVNAALPDGGLSGWQKVPTFEMLSHPGTWELESVYLHGQLRQHGRIQSASSFTQVKISGGAPKLTSTLVCRDVADASRLTISAAPPLKLLAESGEAARSLEVNIRVTPNTEDLSAETKARRGEFLGHFFDPFARDELKKRGGDSSSQVYRLEEHSYEVRVLVRLPKERPTDGELTVTWAARYRHRAP